MRAKRFWAVPGFHDTSQVTSPLGRTHRRGWWRRAIGRASGTRLDNADLTSATLTGVRCETTIWPAGFDPGEQETHKGTDLSHLTLIGYLKYRKLKDQPTKNAPQTPVNDPPTST